MPEDETIYTEQDAIKAIVQISDQGKINADTLLKLNTDIQTISEHVASLDDYLVIQKIEKEKQAEQEKKEDEQETKASDQEQTEIKNTKAEKEEITLTTIHEDIIKLSETAEMTNNILVGNIVFIGIIAGVILFKTMWDRLTK